MDTLNVKIFTSNIEETALTQIHKLVSQPAFSECKIRIMPDVHAGTGCVIGFTADLGDKIIPNIVGVDIGCGMLTIPLSMKSGQRIDFKRLDKIIHEKVPCGFNIHEGRLLKFPQIQKLRCYRYLKDTKKFERSIGTLGGGNHFIEVDENKHGNYYLIIHTGSRNLGKQVANYYQNLAVDLMVGKEKLFKQKEKLIEDYKKSGKKSEISDALKALIKDFKIKKPDIPKELSYLYGKYRDQYLHDMKICQEYAVKNREMIAMIILKEYFNSDEAFEFISKSFHTIHNYIDHESNIVRKGAISAKAGEKLLIPINMKDGCIYGVGKGNCDWNNSAPHGAGRLMSRKQAKENIDIITYRKSMDGIYSTSVNENTLDEAPMVYKSMDEIVNNIEDTVEVIDILKPVYNFKASE